MSTLIRVATHAVISIVGLLLITNSAHAATYEVCKDEAPSNNCPNAQVGQGAPCPCTNITVSQPNNKVQHPEIAYTFWQSPNQEFTNNNADPSYTQDIASMLSLGSNSQYFAYMTTPGLIAPPRVAPYATIYTGLVNGDSPLGGYTDSDVQTVINTQIANQNLPQPQANDDSVYVVFVPTVPGGIHLKGFCADSGTYVTANPQNQNPTWACNFRGTYTNGGTTYHYIGISGIDSLSVSHEIIEGITTYEGITVSGTGDCGNQIADLCGCYNTETVNSFSVAAYYSTQLGECVLPESWGKLAERTSSSGGWFTTTGSFYMRQGSGGYGVVATDATETTSGGTPSGNAVHYYNGVNQWSTIQNTGGSMFSVGGGIVGQVPLNATEAMYYKLPSSPWYHVGAPAPPTGWPAAVTGITVSQGGVIVATDALANPWYYDPNNPGWHQIAGPGDQFLAINNLVMAINPSHGALYYWTGPGSGFTLLNSVSATTGLIGSPSSDYDYYGAGALYESTGILAATEAGHNDYATWLDSSGAVWALNGSGNTYNTGGVGGFLISDFVDYVTGCYTGVAPCANY